MPFYELKENLPNIGLVADKDLFDPKRYMLSNLEAKWIDLQQRLLLEVCDQLLDSNKIHQKKVGIIIGACFNDYKGLYPVSGKFDGTSTSTFASSRSHPPVLAGRISCLWTGQGWP